MLSFIYRKKKVATTSSNVGTQKGNSSYITHRLYDAAANIPPAASHMANSAISKIKLLPKTISRNPITTRAAAIFASLPFVNANANDVDPYHLDCVVSNPLQIINPSMNYSLQNAAFVYCKKFFKIVNPFNGDLFFPDVVADLFHKQNCASVSQNFSLSYDPACSTAGTVYKSWPYYATHVIAENVTCLIDGVKFSVLPNVAYCFTQLTDLAASTTSELQNDLNKAYQDYLQSEHAKNMAIVGICLTAASALALYGIWRYKRSQYNPVYTPDSDDEQLEMNARQL